MLQKSHTNSVPLTLIGLSCCLADGRCVRRKTARTEHHEGTNFANENNCRSLLRAASSEFGVTASSYYDDAVLPPWITEQLSLFPSFPTARKRELSSFSPVSRRKKGTFARSRRKLRTDGPQSPVLIFPSQSMQYIQGANRRCRSLNGRFHLKSRSLAGQRNHYRG